MHNVPHSMFVLTKWGRQHFGKFATMHIMFVNSMGYKKFKVNHADENEACAMFPSWCLLKNNSAANIHTVKAYKRNWFLTSNALPHDCLYHGVARFKLKISSAANIHNVANWMFVVTTRFENFLQMILQTQSQTFFWNVTLQIKHAQRSRFDVCFDQMR